MDLEVRHLRYVVALADHLNYTRAAQSLHMSQPALSARIAAVERHLGVSLFRRTTRSVTCTEIGAEFVAGARRVLEQLERVERAARQAAGSRTLRIGFYGAAARELTTPIIERFGALFPGVQVELTRFGWQDPTAGLREHRTELAFVRPPFRTHGLRLLYLLSESRVVGLPAGHPLATRAQLAVADLLDEPVVIRRTGDRAWADFWSGAALRRGRPAPATVEANDLDEELQTVATGRAITLTTEAAQLFFPRPGVVYRPVTGLPPSRIALAWRAQDSCDPLCRAFVDAARAVSHPGRARVLPASG